MKKIFTIVPALFLFICCVAQKQNLRLNLTKGETYSYNTTGDITIAEVVDGKDMIITVHNEGKINYKVIDVQQSVYLMEASYGKISFKMGMMNKEKEFSSETDDPDDVVSLALKEMINKPFLVKMTTLGKITEVKNVDSLFANVFKQLPQISEERRSRSFHS